jgi:hypothetical protein
LVLGKGEDLCQGADQNDLGNPSFGTFVNVDPLDHGADQLHGPWARFRIGE